MDLERDLIALESRKRLDCSVIYKTFMHEERYGNITTLEIEATKVCLNR
jgi:hypothetical protein